MTQELPYIAPPADWLHHLQCLVTELGAMDDQEKAAMVESMKQAADLLLTGMCKATVSSMASRLASEAVARAATSARGKTS